MKYRICQTDNVDAVRYLNARIFPKDEIEDFDNSINWLAWHNENPVGFASLRKLRYESSVIFFSRAGVLREHQGQGLHKRLINVRIRWVKANGFKRAVTYVEYSNIKSAVNLERAGFRLYLPETYWAGKSLYFMRNFN